MLPKIVIVIPTYNERENIQKLIEEIFNLGVGGLQVLVVDDNSPDGTGQAVERLKQQYQNLHILRRKEKLGLGTAYVAGFQWALGSGADLIFEMDADLSHDPKHIPEMIEASKDYDVVLGSRYIKGGRIENWNFFRRLISSFGNSYARLVLKLPIRDLTGGFKCYRRAVLESIDLSNVSSLGYNFQVETTYKAYQKGFRIREIPITFTERKQGKSKFDLKIIFEAFWKILLLRLRKSKI